MCAEKMSLSLIINVMLFCEKTNDMNMIFQ